MKRIMIHEVKMVWSPNIAGNPEQGDKTFIIKMLLNARKEFITTRDIDP